MKLRKAYKISMRMREQRKLKISLNTRHIRTNTSRNIMQPFNTKKSSAVEVKADNKLMKGTKREINNHILLPSYLTQAYRVLVI